MPDTKISDLTTLAWVDIVSTDLLAVADLSATATKKVAIPTSILLLGSLTPSADTIPLFTGASTISILTFDGDTSLVQNSTSRIPSQNAVKSYVDGLYAVAQTPWVQSVDANGNALSNVSYLSTTYSISCGSDLNVTGNTTVSGTVTSAIIISNGSVSAYDSSGYLFSGGGGSTGMFFNATGYEITFLCNTYAPLKMGESGAAPVLGFYGANPTTQGTNIADATDLASVIDRLNDLLAYLRTRGDISSGV